MKKFQETKQFRHGGKIKIKSEDEIRDLDIYDWIIDIESISSVIFSSVKYFILYKKKIGMENIF